MNHYGEKYRNLIEQLRIEEGHRPLFAFGGEIIKPAHDADQFLTDIMPVIHFIEVQDMVSSVVTAPMDFKAPFYNLIQLREDDTKKLGLSLREQSAKAWQQLLESKLDGRKAQDKYIMYSGSKNPAEELGEYIELGAKSELNDAEKNNEDPIQFDFHLYLDINYKLFKAQKISQQQALCINDYIYDCIGQLPVFQESEVKKFLTESIFDHFLDDHIPYFGYIQKGIKLYKIIKKERKQQKSKIISFKRFYILYQQTEAETQ